MEWFLRRANCKRFTHKRPTDGSVRRTVGLSVGTRSQWRCMSDAHVQRSSVSKPFSQTSILFCLWGGPKQNTSRQNTSTANRFEASPRQDGWEPTASPANSRECQTYTEEYASDVSPQGRIPRSAGTPCNSILHSAAPCESYRARVRRIALNAD